MNGFEMFKQIKANKKTSSIPFLFITGFSESRILEEARKIGVFGILQKPIDIDQIEQRLKELINPGNPLKESIRTSLREK